MSEIIKKQTKHSLIRNEQRVNKTYEVLIEGYSKKSSKEFYGRTEQNTVVVFPKKDHKIGDLVTVKILKCTSATLKGESI